MYYSVLFPTYPISFPARVVGCVEEEYERIASFRFSDGCSEVFRIRVVRIDAWAVDKPDVELTFCQCLQYILP